MKMSRRLGVLCGDYNTVMRITVLLFTCLLQVWGEALVEEDFSPTVSAACRKGVMTITVVTREPFIGVIHPDNIRRPGCMSFGHGAHNASLAVSLLAQRNDSGYCGVTYNTRTDEKSVVIAVRIHRTLELASDKLYTITCGNSGFRNSRNGTSLVSLRLLQDDHKVTEVVYGRKYTLQVRVSPPDGSFGIRVKSCFSFSGQDNTVELISDRGCPEKSIISKFKYDRKSGISEAVLYSMFKFPHSNKVHFQCHVVICQGGCAEPVCDGDPEPLPTALARTQTEDIYTVPEDGVLSAATTVFVLEPGTLPLAEAACNCGISPPWLLYLCIALGILFLIMLIINIFLCSAMTCSSAKTEEIVEKEPSFIDEYDPYHSWHGSHYGSRYSLNDKPGGYTSAGSTRSMSSNSDYIIVHSRPGSRYSAPGSHKGALRGPESTVDSHYSAKI